MSNANDIIMNNIQAKFGCFGVGLYLKDGNKFETLKRAGPMNISLSFKFILFNEWIGRILYKGDAW